MEPKALIPQIKIYARGSIVLFIPTLQVKLRRYAGQAMPIRQHIAADRDSGAETIGEAFIQAYGQCRLVDEESEAEKMIYDEVLATLGANRQLDGVAYCGFERSLTQPKAKKIDLKALGSLQGDEKLQMMRKLLGGGDPSPETEVEEFVFTPGTRTRAGFSMPSEYEARQAGWIHAPTQEPEKLGRIILDALDASLRSDPFIIRHRSTAPGEFPGQLCPGILSDLSRLGWSTDPKALEGVVKSRGDLIEGDMVIQCFLVPEAIRAFFIAKAHGMGREYQSECEGLRASSIVFGVGMSGSYGGQYHLPDDGRVEGRGDRFLVGFANADEHRSLLVLDLRDSNPSDPSVFKISLYDLGPLGQGVPLSSFLADLLPS